MTSSPPELRGTQGFARAQPLVVLTRGCEYLLMPGIGALRDLAR
jgi:hypothetical protein